MKRKDLKISIVTVSFNCVNDIEATILSVLEQEYSNIEYIIIDGGSIDGTVDIINKYSDRIDYFISEKDSGIYDAMNKGIRFATGNWVNFMNAGDTFVNKNVLNNITFDQYSSYALLYGNKMEKDIVMYPMSIEVLKSGIIMACHQSMFFNKSILKSELIYDTKYLIYGDYELVNKIFYNKYKIKYLDIEIANFAGDGISSVVSTQKRKDKYYIVNKYYGLPGIVKSILYRFFYKGNVWKYL